MAKWRILKIVTHPGTKFERTNYLVQKRFLGHLWWYDPFDDGMYSDGYCHTYDEALALVNRELGIASTKKVIWTNEN